VNEDLLATECDEVAFQRERSESDLVKMGGAQLTLYVRWALLNATVEGLLLGKTEVRKISGKILGRLLQICEYKHLRYFPTSRS